MEAAHQRVGDNLYSAKLAVTFGEQQLDLDVPEGVWNPTPHGVHLGNMLTEMDFSGQHVLELGTGCGIHAILLARAGAARLTVTEIDAPILANARHNLGKHGVNIPVEYQVADWTQVEGAPFDALVTNPPFGKAGKHYRRYFLDTMILDAHKLVRSGGSLVFVQSSMANLPRTLRLLEEHGMEARIVGQTSGPFRPYYFEDERFLVEMCRVPGSYSLRDGTYYETLTVLQARLP